MPNEEGSDIILAEPSRTLQITFGGGEQIATTERKTVQCVPMYVPEVL